MREILFRGKRIDNGEWVYGNLIQERYIVGDIVDWEKEYFNTEWWALVIPKTVGQYTGLEDANGKKIFEGDIVKSYAGIFASPVEWNESYCGFYPFCTKNTSFHVAECEVIGNIHDILNC